MTDNSDTTEPNLWSDARIGGMHEPSTKFNGQTSDLRSPFEHDHDRLLFSAPVRRLADKTQVFPLEPNDSVRTRLTHSHEVANLARSIGNRLVRTEPSIFGSVATERSAPVILAAIGLAHDLGNPPFGHQGEVAIRKWFKSHEGSFRSTNGEELSPDLQYDFLEFEGNAQTFRLVTRLQVSSGGHGLDLTAATLAALMKYSVPSCRAGSRAQPKTASTSKFGYFESEAPIIDWIREKVGLTEGQRHPLTWLMEACDDIAYSVLDVEDAIKKSLVSPEDVLAFLRNQEQITILKDLSRTLDVDFEKADRHPRATQAREIKTSYLRTRLIEALITGTSDAFIASRDDIFTYKNKEPLLERDSDFSRIFGCLKDFALANAYTHRSVLRIELQGANVISKLMDWFWRAITERSDTTQLGSKRMNPFSTYVYALISDNYRHEFEQSGVNSHKATLPLRYREFQLLTDMISGMTDNFAMALFEDLEPLSRD